MFARCTTRTASTHSVLWCLIGVSVHDVPLPLIILVGSCRATFSGLALSRQSPSIEGVAYDVTQYATSNWSQRRVAVESCTCLEITALSALTSSASFPGKWGFEAFTCSIKNITDTRARCKLSSVCYVLTPSGQPKSESLKMLKGFTDLWWRELYVLLPRG